MKFVMLAVCAVTAAMLWAMPAGSQEVVPEQDAFKTACQSATALANLSNFNVSRCRKVAVIEEGQNAIVTVKVWVDGQGIFAVTVGLMKTVWSQQAIIVAPA